MVKMHALNPCGAYSTLGREMRAKTPDGAVMVAMRKQPGPQQSLGSAMSKGMSQASYGLSVAFAFAGLVMGLWWIGRLVDGWTGIEPWAQVAGAVVGWILGVAVVYYTAQREPR
jgi:F0F1-type ATP synthase assembly protein I